MDEYTIETIDKLFMCYFTKKQYITNDEFLQIDNNYIIVALYEEHETVHEINSKNRDYVMKIVRTHSVAYITYRLSTGQIGEIRVKDNFRNKGLGKDMLRSVINELINLHPYVWVVSYKNDPFWTNVFNNSFYYDERHHMSVTSG